MKNKSGFTLIETLVYLGLFSLIMGSLIVTTFEVIESNGKSQAKIDVREEGNFLIQKIETGINGATVISRPIPTKLVITKSPATITLNLNVQTLELKRGAGSFAPLNSSDVAVISLAFNIIQVSGRPDEIKTNFTLTSQSYSQSFESVKYIRK